MSIANGHAEHGPLAVLLANPLPMATVFRYLVLRHSQPNGLTNSGHLCGPQLSFDSHPPPFLVAFLRDIIRTVQSVAILLEPHPLAPTLSKPFVKPPIQPLTPRPDLRRAKIFSSLEVPRHRVHHSHRIRKSRRCSNRCRSSLWLFGFREGSVICSKDCWES